MALIVIAGMPDCPKYAHAKYVADFMSTNLPNFNVHRIVKKRGDWEYWLEDVCKQNGWHHYKCPIIWKELAMRGGRGILIGGLSNFLEYCYEYYGLTSFLTEEQKKILIMDNLEQFKIMEHKINLARIQHITRQICISGASNPIITVLLGELLRLHCLCKKEGTTVLLYDEPEHKHHLEEVALDAASVGALTGLGAARVVDSLADGLRDCDILIVLDGFPRSEDMTLEEWLGYNRRAMLDLAETLNTHAPRKCRVILAYPNSVPLCFNATVLCEAAIGLCAKNIVAITADLGLEPMVTVTELTNTRLEDFASAPVWGFIGLNHFVDLDSMLYRVSYFVPNKRALKKIPGSTLPQGEMVVELRKFQYVLHNVTNLWLHIYNRRKKITHLLKNPPSLAKVKAIIGLLQLWYTDKYDGEVISLGVLSNGSFGIPAGMFFSQPVTLVNGFWEPCSTFPQPQDNYCDLQDLCPFAVQALHKFGVGQRFDASWLLSEDERDMKWKRIEREKRKKENEEENLSTNISLEMEEEIRLLKERNDLEIEKAIAKADFETHWIQEMASAELRHLIAERVTYTESMLTIRPSFHVPSTESIKHKREIAENAAREEREKLKKAKGEQTKNVNTGSKEKDDKNGEKEGNEEEIEQVVDEEVDEEEEDDDDDN